MEKILISQYEFLKESRNVLLNYCDSMHPDDLIIEFENFGRGSIRNLLVHIINTYQFWLQNFALQNELLFVQADQVKEIKEIRIHFENTNKIAAEFIRFFNNDYQKFITDTVRKKEITVTPFKLFTHVLTHEFHHKGQILSMGRHLGYIPPDTDIIR